MSGEDYRIKLAVIAGASRALRLKSERHGMTSEEIIQKISDSLPEIIEKIDEEEL